MSMNSSRGIRKYDKSHAEIILLVRQYFEEERKQGKRVNVEKVVEQSAAATEANINVVVKIKTQTDLDNWKYATGESLSYMVRSRISENYRAVVRRVLHDIFLEKKKLPTINTIFQRITNLNVHEFEDPNLFKESVLPPVNSPI